MRLICITLLLLLLFQQGYSQTPVITFRGKAVSLATVFASIEKQTDYTFHYKVEVLEKSTKVDVDFRKEPLTEVLKVLFVNQPLRYSILEKNIAVFYSPVNNQPGKPGAGAASLITVNGIVMTKGGERLSNASVALKGTQNGTFTRVDGTFTLENLKPQDVLMISFIGYQATEKAINGQTNVMITLQETNNQLDEVVAQGYSNTTKRLSTSSVSKVTSAELDRQTEINPLMALQGRVPGMLVTPSSTYASSPVEIELRGRSILSGAAIRPLIVVDGSPLYVGSNLGTANGDGPAMGMAAGYSPAYSQSPLYGFNPKDIQSIEILKDVGATSIYGSAGSGGVILITTKRGKAGASQFDVNVNTGFSKITRYWEMLTTPQYLEMRREAFKNDGIIPTPLNAPDLFRWDTTRQVDWQKENWGKMGTSFQVNAALSGGTAHFSHRLSASYNTSSDITTASGSNDAISLSMAIDHKSRDSRFSMGLTANYSHTSADIIRSPQVAMLPPHAPPIYDEKGAMNWRDYIASGQESLMETYARLFWPVESKTNGLSSNLRLKYQLLRGLQLITSIGYNRSDNDMFILQSMKMLNPTKSPTGGAIFGKSKINNWNIEPQASYENVLFGKGRINITTGATIRQELRENVTIVTGGYTNEAMIRQMSATYMRDVRNERRAYKYAGIFGRMGLSWDNKYVLELSGRRDGSSRFGPGRQYGNFGAVGLAWIASDEPWLKKVFAPIVGFLKFNGNVGTAGQDGGSDYQYLSRWGQSLGMVAYDNVGPLLAIQPLNQDYHWQLTRELNLGMDIRFFNNNMLSVSVNYYRRRLGDQLTQNPTPSYTGFPTVYGNWNATIQNAGWEAVVSVAPFRSNNFSWSFSINASINRNKLLQYPGIEKSSHARSMIVGRPTTNKYILHYIGVDPMTGTYQLEDYNKDGLIISNLNSIPGANADNQYIFDQSPRVAGGMGHTFTYKGISLNFLFDFRIQKGRNALSSMPATGIPGAIGNIPAEVFNNRWQKPGDNTRYAKFSTQPVAGQSSIFSSSTMALTDASFIRCRNISLSYALPEKWVRKARMKNASLNINTNNLFTITRYIGIDPEVQDFGGMPPLKTVLIGFSVNF